MEKCHRNVWNASGCFGPSCMNWASVLSGIRDSRKAGSLWEMMRGVGGVRKSIEQSWLAKGLGLGLLCWGFKRFRQKRPAFFKLGQWYFYQENEPVNNSTIVTDYLTKMGIKTVLQPILQTLIPITFDYSLSSEAVVMRQLRRWKRLWWWSHKRTSMGRSRSCWNGTTSALQPEEITSK